MHLQCKQFFLIWIFSAKSNDLRILIVLKIVEKRLRTIFVVSPTFAFGVTGLLGWYVISHGDRIRWKTGSVKNPAGEGKKILLWTIIYLFTCCGITLYFFLAKSGFWFQNYNLSIFALKYDITIAIVSFQIVTFE